jgi:hypothetical protein
MPVAKALGACTPSSPCRTRTLQDITGHSRRESGEKTDHVRVPTQVPRQPSALGASCPDEQLQESQRLPKPVRGPATAALEPASSPCSGSTAQGVLVCTRAPPRRRLRPLLRSRRHLYSDPIRLRAASAARLPHAPGFQLEAVLNIGECLREPRPGQGRSDDATLVLRRRWSGGTSLRRWPLASTRPSRDALPEKVPVVQDPGVNHAASSASAWWGSALAPRPVSALAHVRPSRSRPDTPSSKDHR